MLNRLKLVVTIFALFTFASALHADQEYTSQAAFNLATTGSQSITFNAGCPTTPATCYTNYSPTYTDGGTLTTFSIASNGIDLTGKDYYGTGTYPEDFLIEDSNAFLVANTLTVTPPPGFNAIAFDMGSFNGNSFLVTLSDGKTYNISPPKPYGLSFFGFTSPNAISSISFATPASETFVIGDADIAHAPEPPVMALLGTAMLAFAVMAFRGKRLALP